jgi:hypothetical protein
MLRARTILLAVAVLGGMTGGVLACDCPWPWNLKTEPERQAWKLAQATDVAQGRIAEIWGGEHDGRRVLLAKMIVSSVVKGNIPTREITLISDLHTESCGVPWFVLGGFQTNRDVAASVYKARGDSTKYEIGSCGYLALNPQGKPAR